MENHISDSEGQFTFRRGSICKGLQESAQTGEVKWKDEWSYSKRSVQPVCTPPPTQGQQHRDCWHTDPSEALCSIPRIPSNAEIPLSCFHSFLPSPSQLKQKIWLQKFQLCGSVKINTRAHYETSSLWNKLIIIKTCEVGEEYSCKNCNWFKESEIN